MSCTFIAEEVLGAARGVAGVMLFIGIIYFRKRLKVMQIHEEGLLANTIFLGVRCLQG